MKKAKNRHKTQDLGPKTLGLRELVFRILCLVPYVLCLVFSAYGGSSEKISYYSPENILRFAEHLYQQRDYLRAAGEYQRYLFHSFQDADPPEKRDRETFVTLYKIGLCYRLAGDTERAISLFREIVAEDTESHLRFAASYQTAYSYFLLSQYENSIRHINQALDEMKISDERGQLQVLAAFNYLHQRRWRDAQHVLGPLAFKDENLDGVASVLRTSAREGMSLRRKSPLLAGLFSAVVPGTGKMYCKQYGDGIYSLILIGVTGLLAWDGFRENGVRSARGWIFGTMSGIFYAGNVYGSTVAIRIYNRQLEVDLLKRLPAVPDVCP